MFRSVPFLLTLALLLPLLSFPAISPALAGSYEVQSGDTPAGIAKKTGVSVNDLLRANPKLDPRKMRVGQTLNVPDGKGDKSAKAAPAAKEKETKEKASKSDKESESKTATEKESKAEKSAPAEEPQSSKKAEGAAGSYTVQKGDNPGSIASKNGVSLKELMAANPDLDPRKLRVGQTLKIPGKGGQAPAAQAEEPSKKNVMEKAERIAAEKASQPPREPETTKTHKVKKGESLGSIADKYGISQDVLRKANKNISAKKLKTGQTLVIPLAGASAQAPAEKAATPEREMESAAAAGTPEKAALPEVEKKDETKTPADADGFFEKGNDLGKQNKYQQAIENFDKAIKLNPDRADYYASRGHAFYYMKLYGRAIEDYTRAIERNAKFGLAYSMRGLSRTRNGQYQQAVADYDKAIELGPKEADYYKGRGWTYFHLKQYEPMCVDYKKACDLGDCEFLEVARKSNLCAKTN